MKENKKKRKKKKITLECRERVYFSFLYGASLVSS
jgi:hypothetical protein